MYTTQQQEHDDFVRGGYDRFEGFDRGDLGKSFEDEQNAYAEAAWYEYQRECQQ